MKTIELSPTTLARRLAQKTLLLKQATRLGRPSPDRYATLAARCESPLERIFWKVGYPELSRLSQFTPQVEVPPYRLDFALVGRYFRIAIECDGKEFHSTEEQIIEDDRRDLELGIMGWRVVRFRGSVIYGDSQACVAGVVRLIRAVRI